MELPGRTGILSDLWRSCQSVCQSGCTIFHSYQQRVRVDSPHPQHLSVSVFLILTILVRAAACSTHQSPRKQMDWLLVQQGSYVSWEADREQISRSWVVSILGLRGLEEGPGTGTVVKRHLNGRGKGDADRRLISESAILSGLVQGNGSGALARPLLLPSAGAMERLQGPWELRPPCHPRCRCCCWPLSSFRGARPPVCSSSSDTWPFPFCLFSQAVATQEGPSWRGSQQTAVGADLGGWGEEWPSRAWGLPRKPRRQQPQLLLLLTVLKGCVATLLLLPPPPATVPLTHTAATPGSP